MEGDRPSGTVTFLFTDIEGSTRRWQDDRAAMEQALVVHDELLHRIVGAHGGWLFKHTGDGVCAAFESPVAAVRAAVEAQRVLALPVRMGLATGEAQLRGDDYFGPPLNLAARIMSAGHGGQILVAAATAELIDGIDLIDLGDRRLRDLSAPQRILQVAADGLGTEFPPLVTLDDVPGNLPIQITSFTGRVDEVAEVNGALEAHRLVTLTGVGGVGKTRLGLQVAADLAVEHPDGVWFVELAEIGEPAAVPSAVATELGVTPRADVALTDAIAQSFGSRRALLLLDNCEHVLDAVANLVEAVLAAGSEVKILATSREGLGVRGEHVWAVPSLDMRAGIESSAVALFVDRALAADHTFSIESEDDANTIAEICVRLDGIALAIELAAARIVAMSLTDIRDRLGQRFRLLSGGRRGLERHQTLRQAVQWSYELLDDGERRVLGGCSVFAGGFDVDGVVAVVGGGELDEFDVLDLLESLVRKSLLVVERGGQATRFTMLETIRQFAEEQLAASGSAADLRDRHAAYFATRARSYFDQYATAGVAAALESYETESGNLRAAFRWAADEGDLDTAAAIAGKTAIVAGVTRAFEPVDWCEELLPIAAQARHRLLKYLYAGAALCAFTGRAEDGLRYVEVGLALPSGDEFDRVEHELEATGLVVTYLFTGRTDEFIEIARANLDNPHDTMGIYRISLVWVLAAVGRFDEAMHLADDMLRSSRAIGHPGQLSYAFAAYGRAFSETDPDKAIKALRRAVALARDANTRQYEAVWSRDLAGLEARVGDPRSAAHSLDDILDGFHRLGDTGNLAAALAYVVILLARLGRLDEAAEIFGAATRDQAAITAVPELGPSSVALRAELGDDAFERECRKGRDMNTAEAVAVAKAHLRLAADQHAGTA